MRSLCFIVSYFFALTFLYLDPLISSASTLTPSQSIKDGEILSSKSENFELGFFSPSNSNKNRYVGIWFKKIPVKTIVWVANRDSPLKDSSGVLIISSAGNLVILNQTNQVIWSANLSKTAESPILDFLDSGNLVLREKSSEEYLWQSFDHPSDTLLPGMRIGADLKTQLNIYLTSWKSFDDPSLGDYTYGIDLTGFPEPIMRNGSNKNYRSGPWNGLRNTGAPEVDRDVIFSYSEVHSETGSYLTASPSSVSIISRLVVNQSGNIGQLQRLIWVNQTQSWLTETKIPRDRCDLYALCGAGTICDTNIIPRCQCLKGFKPTSPQDWNGLDWSQGCEHNTPLSFDKGDGFVKFIEVKLPDTTRTWVNSSMSLEECEDKCVKNSSCMAYANSNIVGNGNGCAIWLGDLIDIRKMRGAGQNLYIRVAASELESPRKETVSDPKGMGRVKIIVIIFSVISTIFILGLCIFFIRRRKLMRNITKNSAKERVNKEKEEDPPFGEGFINGKKDNPSKENNDLELIFFDMDTIIRVTNNFSITNMLGQGGFGCVYKGTLEDGHEIAIKRLSKNSGQGGEEFKNEVMLIARLQHRNLVRLLGFCTQWEEKILVYEYMKNKSLDAILFDEANKIMLDWPKRFNIIMGISRGLLYLHQDSRFRIIHRDLKTSNVLLDDELNPKISDFGMARIFAGDVTQEKTRRVMGTYGYMSPEYAMDGLFSVKSDVFSLGVLLLEVISGKKNKGFFSSENQHNLLGYAWRLWKEGQPLELIDETVKDSCVPEEAMRCIHVGLLCIQEHAEDRPIMSSVVTMLSSQDTSTFQQPKQPGFCFGGLPIQVANSTSSKQKSKSVNHVTITMLEAR